MTSILKLCHSFMRLNVGRLTESPCLSKNLSKSGELQTGPIKIIVHSLSWDMYDLCFATFTCSYNNANLRKKSVIWVLNAANESWDQPARLWHLVRAPQESTGTRQLHTVTDSSQNSNSFKGYEYTFRGGNYHFHICFHPSEGFTLREKDLLLLEQIL